jgi:hypothetical protein
VRFFLESVAFSKSLIVLEEASSGGAQVWVRIFKEHKREHDITIENMENRVILLS